MFNSTFLIIGDIYHREFNGLIVVTRGLNALFALLKCFTLMIFTHCEHHLVYHCIEIKFLAKRYLLN